MQIYFLFGPEGPAHLMVSLILRSSRSNARGESRAPCLKKALQGSETETRELLVGTTENRRSPRSCWEEQEESVSSMRGLLFALQANPFLFSTYLAPLIFDYFRPPLVQRKETLDLSCFSKYRSNDDNLVSGCAPVLSWKKAYQVETLHIIWTPFFVQV